MTVAVLFIGNSGAGKSTLLKLLGGTGFKAGVKFRGGYTKDIYEEPTVINGQRVILMDVPGLFEPNDDQTVFNSAKLTEALERDYEFKLFFVLHAHNRGPPNEELLMMHKVNEVVRQSGRGATYRIIINQIPDDDVYNLYQESMAEDNCASFFSELSIGGLTFDSIQISEVILVRFNSAEINDLRGKLAMKLAGDIRTHKAAPVTLLKPIAATNKELGFFQALWDTIRQWFGQFEKMAKSI